MNSSTALEGSLRNFFGVVMVALLLIYLPGLKRFGFWIRFEKRCGHVSYLCLLNKNIFQFNEVNIYSKVFESFPHIFGCHSLLDIFVLIDRRWNHVFVLWGG